MIRFQLLLPVEMNAMKDRFQLSYVEWRSYKDATIAREGDVWDRLCGVDLIIGGVNFVSDFL
jgi:hypothetical protein